MSRYSTNTESLSRRAAAKLRQWADEIDQGTRGVDRIEEAHDLMSGYLSVTLGFFVLDDYDTSAEPK